MKYVVRLTDATEQQMLVLTLAATEVKKAAADVIFDVVDCTEPSKLISEGLISEGQLDDLKAFQMLIFDHDQQGPFIRDGIAFTANGKELLPDAPLESAFVSAELDGMQYFRCDLKVTGGSLPPKAVAADSSTATSPNPSAKEQQVKIFAQIMFLHQLALGRTVDVTKDHLEIDDLIKWGERENLIEIDVKKASYKLTESGKAAHEGYVKEAQDLIKRFDIYGDVDLDSTGKARFDTGLGRDLRVPIFESNGIDPFRARFVLGINDGEWDQLSNWEELVEDVSWYEKLFAVVESAPSVDDVGRNQLVNIQDQAKEVLRRESGSHR